MQPVGASREVRAVEVREFLDVEGPDLAAGTLSEALYACGELGLFPDAVDSVSEEQAIMVWKIVERVRTVRFPDHLRM